jgi:hypothetical protein
VGWRRGPGARRRGVLGDLRPQDDLPHEAGELHRLPRRAQPRRRKGRVIACCSDRSVYDPAAGARVVSGPAPQPLATILLEHDKKTDEIFAVGTFGGEMFNEFFRKYEFRLQLEVGPRAKNAVEGTAVVRELESYSTQWAKC